ncbi:CHAT domain-containing protein [uncultured Psychroserpens sp.]|uniref:CHAT domain-containing protein n=1 Tax=uncultured Psychroserpens sp. TaxID=255436 RepID=UPI00260C0CB5|nr:CHAT domain-containing protein [uncultured Psychroserpens sp.]
MAKTILFLATNPIDTPYLRLQDEVKLIENALAKSNSKDDFVFIDRGAVTRRDLVHYLNKHKPNILHIAGHGDENGNLMFEGDDKYSQPLSIQGLSKFLGNYSPDLECLVLNACRSSVSLKNFKPEIAYVIGMSKPVSNKSAEYFSEAFYDSLFSGKPVPVAFKIGRDVLGFKDENDPEIPTLIVNDKVLSDLDSKDQPESPIVPSSKISSIKDVKVRYDLFKDEYFALLDRLRELRAINDLMETLDPSKKGRHYGAVSSSLKVEIDSISKLYRTNIESLEEDLISEDEYHDNQEKIIEKIGLFIVQLKSTIENIENQSNETSHQIPESTLTQLGDLYGDDFKKVIEVAADVIDEKNGISVINQKTAIAVTFTSLIFVGAFAIKDSTKGTPPMLLINLILQLGLIFYMIFYKIVPTIGFVQFEAIRKSDDYLKKVFQSNVFDMYKYYLRATSAIKQFAKWWKLLGISFLSLYLFYYISEISSLIDPDGDFLKKYVHLIDISLNGIEAFFLYILYKLLTDKTLKENYDIKNGLHYVNTVKYQKPLFILIGTILILSTIGIYIYNTNHNTLFGYDLDIIKGMFHLITRSISGIVVAVSLCLVIGRLDSKFIAAKNYVLGLLYLYAAMQVFFILFDQSIVTNLLLSKKEIIDEAYVSNQFRTIKIIVLFAILLLKAVFIFFVHSIYKKNFLFYYFLIGSRLNDNITSGKIGNEYVKFEGQDRRLKIRNTSNEHAE